MVEPVRQSGPRTVARTRTGRVARQLSGLLAFGAVLVPGVLPAAAAPVGFVAASPEYPATVAVDSVAPKGWAAAGDTVTVNGVVTNSGSAALKDVTVSIRQQSASGRTLASRSSLDQLVRRGEPAGADGTPVAASRKGLGTLAAGQSSPYTVQVSVADLKVGKGGVYELAVDVAGVTPDDEDPHTLGIARTFLPYRSEAIAHPTQLAVVWPITHTPELVAQTMQDNDPVPVLRDDSLATELAPGGRLGQLVQTGGQLPGLTWVIDPDLLDTVFAMTKPYRVQKPNTAGEPAKESNTVPGTGKDAATEWLKQLRTAVAGAGSQVVALPYADPDLASIAHNGAGLNGMADALRKAGTAGEVTAEGRLSTDARADVAWPYQGYLDQQIAATALAAGENLVLTSSASLPDTSMNYTPSAARPIGNGQTAVVADSTVSDLFQPDLSSPQARSAAVQRFLAETMVINRQLPETPRTLLVLPPRNLTTGSAGALAEAVTQAQQGGWAKLVNLQTVATAPADPDANTTVPGPADYPQRLRASELSAATLGQVMDIQGKLDQLLFILTQPQRVRGPFSAAMVRSMSTAWRDQSAEGSSYRKGVQDYLVSLIGAVKLTPKSTVTLAGDTGTVLVSVKNDLNQAVGNLRVKLSSSQPNRVNVGLQKDVLLEAVTSQTLHFPASARNNGKVQMTAQLMTTGTHEEAYGKPVVFTVEVTSVTSGVLYAIGGGVLLILLAAVRFTLQRRKRAAEPDEEEGGAAQESGADAEEHAPGDEKVGH
ncbi:MULTISPECIES: DUF6049 family protein [unclassified Kitasatospora]|uniref:DUF6049 family protein n=1 Tax=unclassified Kitasatospora TaxID=2633591 RepID=UPI000B1FB854|nr:MULTISPECIES: DUF6049 family protein [unclassified Kitasatospora]